MLARNPDILDVAWFMYCFSVVLGTPPLFTDLKIDTLNQYVRLVDSRTNFTAYRSYTIIRQEIGYLWGGEISQQQSRARILPFKS